jgi:hypothetical protein
MPSDAALSIRALRVGFGLAVAGPLILLLGVLLYRVAALERAQLTQRMEKVVSDLADAVDRELDRRIAMLQTLATSPALTYGDLESFHAQARAALGTRDARVFLVDPTSHRQLLNTRRPYGEELPNHGSPETIARVIEARRPQVSDFFVGRVIQRPVFDIDTPIMENGRLRYVLALGLDRRSLRSCCKART